MHASTPELGSHPKKNDCEPNAGEDLDGVDELHHFMLLPSTTDLGSHGLLERSNRLLLLEDFASSCLNTMKELYAIYKLGYLVWVSSKMIPREDETTVQSFCGFLTVNLVLMSHPE